MESSKLIGGKFPHLWIASNSMADTFHKYLFNKTIDFLNYH